MARRLETLGAPAQVGGPAVAGSWLWTASAPRLEAEFRFECASLQPRLHRDQESGRVRSVH
jgi:hypothetical protein